MNRNNKNQNNGCEITINRVEANRIGMNKDDVVHQVVKYIEDHLNADLSLDKIAGDLNYSKFYMERAFAKTSGITISKYIQGRRLTMAAWLLVETDRPIIEIAFDAQYNSQQAFTLAFHRLYECTPKVYRENGVFYPKQTRISIGEFHSKESIYSVEYSVHPFLHGNYGWRGRMAA